MPKRAMGRRVRSWAWALCAAAGVWACGSGGGETEPANASESSADRAPGDEATRDVSGADGINYQLVETADGLSMEAIGAGAVQTVSCPTQTCAGVCDECALRACQAAGELAAACERLVRDCNDTCVCNGASFSAGSCGLPVCATNRNLCYVDPNAPLEPGPAGPDPGPLSPGGSSSPSTPSPSSTPAPNGSGAARPAG